MRTTRWSPYQCPSCSAKFQRRMLPSAILGGIGGGVGLLMLSAALSLQSVWLGITSLAAWFGLLVWADWFFIPVRELKANETRP
jgi:hypothetical protein